MATAGNIDYALKLSSSCGKSISEIEGTKGTAAEPVRVRLLCDIAAVQSHSPSSLSVELEKQDYSLEEAKKTLEDAYNLSLTMELGDRMSGLLDIAKATSRLSNC